MVSEEAIRQFKQEIALAMAEEIWLEGLKQWRRRYPERNMDLVNVISAGDCNSEATPGSGGGSGEALSDAINLEMEVRRLQAEISRLRAALHQIICMDENEHTLAQSQTIAKAALRSNPRG